MEELFYKLKKQKIKRLAIMGGTFDPIHYGHLLAAETVRMSLKIDRVVFIPSGTPPHKSWDPMRATKNQRYTMVEMASLSNPFFEVSSIEMDREGYTYTVDTIKDIRNILGIDTEIYFITGADAMIEIMTWKSIDELIHLCKFIAVTRPGYEYMTLNNKIIEIKNLFGVDVLTLDIPSIDVSSTDIRNRIYKGCSIKYLVPEPVENYIIKNNLYINTE